MKKYLFLIATLISLVSYSQTPFPSGIRLVDADSITTSDTLALINKQKVLNKWVRGRDLPVKDVTINNYSHNGTLSSYLQGIDLALDGKANVGDTYTKTESESRYVNVTGDTMTGDLTAPNFIGNGSQLTNVDAVTLNGRSDYFKNNYIKSNYVASADADTYFDDKLGGFVGSYSTFSWLTNGAFTGYGGLLDFNSSSGGGSNTNTLQLHYENGHSTTTGGRLAFRTKNNTNFTTWKELYHTGNFGKTQIDALGINAQTLGSKNSTDFVFNKNNISSSDSTIITDNEEGISLSVNSSGSTGFPDQTGFSVHFSTGATPNSGSSWGRDFTLWKEHTRDQWFLRGYNTTDGSPKTWHEIYHSGNFMPSDYLNKTTGGTITGTTLYDKTIAEQESANVKTVVNREFVEDYVANNGGLPVGFYEEGTFTPVLTATTSDVFTYVSSGKYTRIGNQVYVYLSFSSINGTGTGFIGINNLPFNVSESGCYQQVGKILGSDLTDSEINKLCTTATPSDNRLSFQLKDQLSSLFGIVFTNGSFIISGTYITNVYTP